MFRNQRPLPSGLQMSQYHTSLLIKNMFEEELLNQN